MYKYPPIHSLGLSHNLSYLCTSCHLSSPMYVTQSFLPHACHAIFLFHVCHTIFLPHLCQAFFLPLCMSHNLSSLIYVTQFSSPMYATQSFLFHMWRTDFYDKLKRGYNLMCIWDALAGEDEVEISTDGYFMFVFYLPECTCQEKCAY